MTFTDGTKLLGLYFLGRNGVRRQRYGGPNSGTCRRDCAKYSQLSGRSAEDMVGRENSAGFSVLTTVRSVGWHPARAVAELVVALTHGWALEL